MFLQQTRGSPSALVILAHYYTIAVEPLFPEVGAAYFGTLSLGPIEEIARRLFSINVSQTSDADIQKPHWLGWVQPERTASFPTFSNNLTMEESYPTTLLFSPYGNPAFTYSQKHLMTMPPDVCHSHQSSNARPIRQQLPWDPFAEWVWRLS